VINIKSDTNLVFALSLVEDDLFGIIPMPYVLQKSSEKYFTINKRLNNRDFEHKLINTNSELKEIIRISESLSPFQLNKQFNKKQKNRNFVDFYNKADKNTQKHISDVVDTLKSTIYTLSKQQDALLFFKEGNDKQIYNDRLISFSNIPARVSFVFEKKEDNLFYRLNLFYKNNKINPGEENIRIVNNQDALFVYKNELISFDEKEFNGNKLKPFLTKDEIVINEKLQGVFFKKFISPVVKNFEYRISGFDLNELKVSLKPQIFIEKTFTGKIILTPIFVYQDYKIEFYKTQTLFVKVVEVDGNFTLESIQRELEHEDYLLNKLIKLGLTRLTKYFYLDNLSDDIYAFTEQISPFLNEMKNMGFEVINRLFASKINYSIPKINYETRQQQDWFDLHITISIGKFNLKFTKFRKHILNKNKEFILPDNSIFIIPEAWFSELYSLARRTDENNKTGIHRTHIKILKNNKLVPPDDSIAFSLSKLETNKSRNIPKGITARLRDYQLYGYRWLSEMTENNFGVCLADDMGLGKTLQVITVLQGYFENRTFVRTKADSQLSLFNLNENINEEDADPVSSALLVVPKTLIYNWVEELGKFAPELTFMVYHGGGRSKRLEEKIHQVHIVITTYGMIRRDIDHLKTLNFSFLIADESQAIKNPQSKAYKAITQIKTRRKISITGTPLENSPMDLWAQMNFLNKHLLGNRNFFEQTYVQPISTHPEGPETIELKDIISPFILRRMKKDVAKELPEKTEQVIYCRMKEYQKEFYESEKSAIRNELLFSKEKGGNAINALAMLNRLRQIAIHTKLVEQNDSGESGKFDNIVFTISTLMEQGHKFLIFSSFVKHLNLFAEYFIQNNIAYSMLTGKDRKNRQTIVKNYQENPEIKPFLISIKAGGLGLNITAASYVLIIDPWWNPFVEQQAIDRTHRIGQTENVMVYKYITRDSIEEKMMVLQQSKIALNDKLIGKMPTGKFKIEDIEKLL